MGHETVPIGVLVRSKLPGTQQMSGTSDHCFPAYADAESGVGESGATLDTFGASTGPNVWRCFFPVILPFKISHHSNVPVASVSKTSKTAPTSLSAPFLRPEMPSETTRKDRSQVPGRGLNVNYRDPKLGHRSVGKHVHHVLEAALLKFIAIPTTFWRQFY